MKRLICILIVLALSLPIIVQAEPLPMRGSGVFNLLLLGTDSYSPDETGRSDTMIVMQINQTAGTIRLASFLRDLYVAIPGHGQSRLNAAYVWGGPELVKETLLQNFGVTVDAYAAVDFERLVRIIDAIGGVEVTLTDAEVSAANGLIRSYNAQMHRTEKDGLIVGSGQMLLTGKQALGFARIRKLDSDFGRTSRQRQVLEAAFHRIMTLDSLSLAGVALGNLDAVDTDLGLGEILSLIPMVLACRTAVFETCSIPDAGLYHDATINGMMVLVPDLDACRAKLSDFYGVQ